MKAARRARIRGKQRPQVEYCSNWVRSNFYVHIGIARKQRRLLKEAARQWGIRKQPCVTLARTLLMLALANLASLEDWWRVHAAYATLALR